MCAPQVRKLTRRGDLVVVACLLQIAASWHDQQRRALLHCRQDGAHACVRYDYPSSIHEPPKFERIKKFHKWNLLRLPCTRADLRENFFVRVLLRPDIYSLNQTVERHLRTNRDEDHKTCPTNFGPSGQAR